MTKEEKAIRDFCGHHADWWPSTTQVQEMLALAQPEQKYHRGDRLICLETEEYCVIHISGTDRQWVKFPDSHIGVYTNEQVAELFELLPKEPEQEPVAWMFQHDETGRMNYVSNDGIHDPTNKREWVGLTNGEMIELSEMKLGSWDLILEVEDKLKEKNT